MSSDPCCAASLADKADLAAQHHTSLDFEKAAHCGGIPLGGVVAEANSAIVEEQREGRPPLQYILHRFGEIMPAREFGELFAHIAFQRIDERTARSLSNGETYFNALALNRPLDLEQRVDAAHDSDRGRDSLSTGATTCSLLENAIVPQLEDEDEDSQTRITPCSFFLHAFLSETPCFSATDRTWSLKR